MVTAGRGHCPARRAWTPTRTSSRAGASASPSPWRWPAGPDLSSPTSPSTALDVTVQRQILSCSGLVTGRGGTDIDLPHDGRDRAERGAHAGDVRRHRVESGPHARRFGAMAAPLHPGPVRRPSPVGTRTSLPARAPAFDHRRQRARSGRPCPRAARFCRALPAHPGRCHAALPPAVALGRRAMRRAAYGLEAT